MNLFKLLLVTLLTSIAFVACGDDDKNETIVGTWTSGNIKDAWVSTNNDGLTLAIDNEERSRAEGKTHSIIFSEENTYQIYYGETLSESGAFTYKNAIVTLIPLNNGTPYTFQFNIDGNSGARVYERINDYVTTDAGGIDHVIVDKIKEIMEKHPEETRGIAESDIPDLEIYQVRVAVSYTRK